MSGARAGLMLLGGVALAFAIAGGLARLGAPFAAPLSAGSHGALMICGFLGAVISLERAVALGGALPYAAPAACALGTVAVIGGWLPVGAMLWLAASIFLFLASVAIVRKQPQIHTVLLAGGALAWIAGNALYLRGLLGAAIAWWFTFLVLTIVAERLELARLRPQRRGARPTFAIALAALVGGAALTIHDARWGGIVFGASLVAFSLWLATFDLARRTVHFTGLPRFAAIALLGGYFWLAAGGAAWIAIAAGYPLHLRDAALHALALGFVISMIIAHAPIVLPAVLRVRMRFTPLFYLPLALLHASLVVRFVPGLTDPAWRLWGGIANAAVFLAMILVAIRSATPRQRPAP